MLRSGRTLVTLLLLAALPGPWQPAAFAQQVCVRTPGYWQTHPAEWRAPALVLGRANYPSHVYVQAQLLDLLRLQAKGDASVILATQLIAAKLNVAGGASPLPVAQALTRADALLGAFVSTLPYRTKTNTPIGADMVTTADLLAAYNRGELPGSCGAGNTPPIAQAGRDQSVALGSLVTLDGSGSTDADGQQLTFAWSFSSRPSGSAAALSSPTAVMPTFTADRPGTYSLRLVVNDGQASSTPDVVEISTLNSSPIADAGPDQSVPVGTSVQVNGVASSDPDGDSLTYAWSLLSGPAGTQATLSNPTAVAPTFVVDAPGNFILQLIVADPGGLQSAPDVVTVSTANSPPVAHAGADTTAVLGAAVTLDGSTSTDVDGNPLTFAWTFTSLPDGSVATLTNPSSATPAFTIDVSGVYVVQLVVNDGTVASAPDTVVVATTNSRPVARAGPDRDAIVGVGVTLDGSGSTDVDGAAVDVSLGADGSARRQHRRVVRQHRCDAGARARSSGHLCRAADRERRHARQRCRHRHHHHGGALEPGADCGCRA